MKHQPIFLSIIFLFYYFLVSLSYGFDVHDTLIKKIDSFSTDTDLVESIHQFMEKEKVRICIEEMPYDDQNTSFQSVHKQIKVNINNGTVKDVLDTLTRADNNYSWETGESGVINIVPRNPVLKSSYLDWTIPSFDSDTLGLAMIVNSQEPISSFGQSLLNHKIHIFFFVNNALYSALTHPVEIHLDHPVTCREVLNKLVKGAGPGVYWIYMGNKNRRVLSFSMRFQ